MRRQFTLALVFVSLGSIAVAQMKDPQREAPPVIRLLSRTFVPEAGVDYSLIEGGNAGRRHVLVQFTRVPSLDERKRMEESAKLRILDPIPERSFFASVPLDRELLNRITKDFPVRSIGRILPEDKIHPDLKKGPPADARRGKNAAEYIVEFFGDVEDKDAGKILDRYDAKVLEFLRPIHGFRAVLSDDAVRRLTGEDGVKWIVAAPSRPTLDNDSARGATGTNANAVTSAPYSLSGNGVVIGHWEPIRPSLTHLDYSARVTAPLGVIAANERPLRYVDANANATFNAGEAFYIDMDDSLTVTAGDIRGVAVGAFASGSIVAAGNPDVGTNLLLVDLPAEYFDADADFSYTVGEPLYNDANFNFQADAGETRLTAVAPFAAGSVIAAGDADQNRVLAQWGDVDLHPTHVVGTAVGNGSQSLANGGSANQWKGMAPSALLRVYRSGALNAGYTDAAANNVTISTNSWGSTHCHQTTANNCYSVTSEFYDSVISGTQTSGAPSGLARRILIFGSAGNRGNAERHNESVTANGQYDNGEAVYIDNDDSGTVSPGDRRRNAVGAFAANSFVNFGNADVGTALVNFNANERHVTGNGAYSNGQAIFRDVDNSGTVTAGDTRINASSGFAAGSVVAAGDADVSTIIRWFSMFGTVRVPNSAKDTVEVANISSDTNVPDPSSSRGPTADGRMKPDLAGPGTQFGGDFNVTSSAPGNLYAGLSGTSMSTPAVAGSAALLTEWYKTACVAAGPSPDAVRAILIHTTEDKTSIPTVTGTFTGPDFQFGYGRTRIDEAVNVVPNHKQGSFAATGNQDTTITVGRVMPLKVTLAWDDPPHTGNAAPSAAIGLLQNDLDLLLIAPDGTQYTPWQLNAQNPFAVATTTSTPAASPIPASAIDHRNTVEQVVVPNAMPGTWTIRVTASTLNLPPQGYTIVNEHLPPQAGACTAAPAADVWMMDNAGDGGGIPSPGTMWQSQAVWNRTPTADGVVSHQNPVHAIVGTIPNFLYASVRNDLPGSVSTKAARVDFWIAAAALGLSWPNDFTFVGSIPVANLNPGEVRQVGPLSWNPPDPTPSDHFCLYVRLQSPQDPITLVENTDLDHNARNSNNIVWKNVNIISMSTNSATFLVRNITKERQSVDVVIRVEPEFLANGGTIRAALSAGLERAWRERGKTEGLETVRMPQVPNASGNLDVLPPKTTLTFRMKEPVAVIRDIPMGAAEAAPMQLTFSSRDGDTHEYKVEVVEMIGGKEVGGIAYILRPGKHEK